MTYSSADLQGDTAESLASQIKQSTTSIVNVGAVSVSYNITTGDVKAIKEQPVGGVINIFSDEIINKSESLVKDAVSLIVKTALLHNLQTLADEKINKIISKETKGMTNLTLESVDAALRGIQKSGGQTFFSQSSPTQIKVATHLGKIEEITSIDKANLILEKIGIEKIEKKSMEIPRP